MLRVTIMPALGATLILLGTALGQQVTVTAHIEVTAPPHRTHSPQEIVVWFTPAAGSTTLQLFDSAQQHPALIQKDKNFTPHLLVVRVGTVVDFPNRDPFFHNVFSLFEGKRFDLGLYEAGTTRHVRFDRPGVCYIFCNIHPEMSAVVVVLDTPYYGLANRQRTVKISGVPAGRYTMHAWDERSLPEDRPQLTREVVISPEQASLTLRIRETGAGPTHKNKYGQDYEKPAPPGPGYIPQ